MKITIDTTAKTIHVSDEVSISELHNWIKTMFPKDHENWKVVSETKIQLSEAVRREQPTSPWPWSQPRLEPHYPNQPPAPPWEITCLPNT